MMEETESSPKLPSPDNYKSDVGRTEVIENAVANSFEKWMTVVAGFCVFVNSWYYLHV